MSALELYYNDAGGYPTTAAVTPLGAISYGSTVYMAVVPSNPAPWNDGSCGSNNYAYSQLSNGTSYTITYCLGGSIGDLTAGTHRATPNGLNQ